MHHLLLSMQLRLSLQLCSQPEDQHSHIHAPISICMPAHVEGWLTWIGARERLDVLKSGRHIAQVKSALRPGCSAVADGLTWILLTTLHQLN